MNPLDNYDVPNDEELITIQFLDKLASRLGNPTDISTESGLKLMDAIIGAWQKHFAQEAADWTHDRKLDLANEKTLHELASTKSFGYNPASYPHYLFKLIKVMFPHLKLQNKKVYMKLLRIYPNLFKTSNYV
ncbi:MAG: hypothetical protein M0P59_13420 [Gallionella sp.]|jgi:hypothetical protein|nr:hypothetical protein [Gallionella sp.]